MEDLNSRYKDPFERDLHIQIEKDTYNMMNLSVLDQYKEWNEMEQWEIENSGYSGLKQNKIRNYNQTKLMKISTILVSMQKCVTP